MKTGFHVLAALILFMGAVPAAADAAVVITVQEVGTDVVAAAAGTFNLTGLRLNDSGDAFTGVNASIAVLRLGDGISQVDQYAEISGPTSFGDGFFFIRASSGTGSVFGLVAGTFTTTVDVARGFQSGGAVAASSTFANHSFASLGLTQGTYNFTAPNDTITVQIGGAVAAVPEPASWAMMIVGFGLIGGAMRRRKDKTTTNVAFA